MNKAELLEEIIRRLRQELEIATRHARESAESATDEESRAEGKYDTRGLETSYLAGAQANYAKELRQNLQAFNALKSRDFQSGEPISTGALVTTLSPEGREVFLLAPAHGGMEVDMDGQPVTLITPRSPLGAQLVGKTTGHKVALGERTVIRIA